MASPAAKKVVRPLSPHLQIYRPQLTSVLSIFHRITGIGLALGMPVFVLWLVAVAQGLETFSLFSSYANTLLGRILLSGWTWAFCYHLCAGIRHLFWDAGKFMELKPAYATGYLVIIISSFMTAGILAVAWGLA